MGTEILRAQDCLAPATAAFLPRRSPNPRPSRKPSAAKPEAKKRRDKSPKSPAKSAGNLPVVGKVTILRRGESLDVFEKKGEAADLRPPRRLLMDVGNAPFAGSGFAQSPEPSELPIPSFSYLRRREVDLSATKDLRQILRLE